MAQEAQSVEHSALYHSRSCSGSAGTIAYYSLEVMKVFVRKMQEQAVEEVSAREEVIAMRLISDKVSKVSSNLHCLL